jgi:hypothetical protein
VILVSTPPPDSQCGQCSTPEEAAYASADAECPGRGIAMSYSRAAG